MKKSDYIENKNSFIKLLDVLGNLGIFSENERTQINMAENELRFVEQIKHCQILEGRCVQLSRQCSGMEKTMELFSEMKTSFWKRLKWLLFGYEMEEAKPE